MADQTFRLPDLGEGLTEAQLVAWRVEEGGRVDVNTPLCEVETAKAVVVIPSPWAGTIHKLHARPGESVAVGEPLVTITPAEATQAEATPGTLVGYDDSTVHGVRRLRCHQPDGSPRGGQSERPLDDASPLFHRRRGQGRARLSLDEQLLG